MTQTTKRSTRARLFTSGVFSLLIFLGGFYGYLAVTDWNTRASLLFQLIAFYGIGLGFLTRSQALRDFGGLVDEMTSAHPVEFVAGNFTFLGILMSIVRVGLDPKRSNTESVALGCLGMVALLVVAPFLILYSIFHVFVLLPMAYPGYVFVTALLQTILNAAGDVEIEARSDTSIEKIRVKEIMGENIPSSKSFLLGIPAAVFALITKIDQLFF